MTPKQLRNSLPATANRTPTTSILGLRTGFCSEAVIKFVLFCEGWKNKWNSVISEQFTLLNSHLIIQPTTSLNPFVTIQVWHQWEIRTSSHFVTIKFSRADNKATRITHEADVHCSCCFVARDIGCSCKCSNVADSNADPTDRKNTSTSAISIRIFGI